MKKIKIGIFGLGTVGTGLVNLLKLNRQLIQQRCKTEFEIVQVVVKNKAKKRTVKINSKLLSDDPHAIFNRLDIDVIIEMVGEKSLTKKIFIHCNKKQIPLITANKAFLAEEGKFLKTLSLPFLGLDASVAGSIPILKTLEFGLNGNKINSIIGIINGTANFILSNMDAKKSSFATELKEAQTLGYAESDPTFDIKGQDTAHKLTILMGMAWQQHFDYHQITIVGIDNISKSDILYANEFGYKIKLLGIAKKADKKFKGKELYEGRVHPSLIPNGSMLASVNGAYNGVYLEGNFSGPHLSYGQGAGSHPTASAVVSDLILLANQKTNTDSLFNQYFFNYPPAELLDIRSIKTEYYFHFIITDHTGVLAEITKILAQHKISIFKMIQKEVNRKNNVVDLIIISHLALEKNVIDALQKINQKSFIHQKTKWIRIETGIH